CLCYSRAGKRVSSVCCPVISRCKGKFRHFFRHSESSYRKSVSDGLCHCQNIRSYTELLPREHRTCASHSTLNFIADHEDSFVITELSDAFHKCFRCQIDTALPLERCQDNCTCLFIYKLFYTVKVIVLCKTNAGQKRLKRLSVRF